MLLFLRVFVGCQAQDDSAGQQDYQPNEVISQHYSFINYDANVLRFDSVSATMCQFLQKWNSITTQKRGNINIVQIGGSHIQAGTLSHRIRCNILSKYPSLVSGRGLVFPYSAAAKCNNPADYRVHCVEKVQLVRNVHKEPDAELGLCGIAIKAHDVVTTIQMVNYEHRFDFDVNQIVLLGESEEDVVPYISFDEREVQPSYIDEKTRRFVFNLSKSVDSFDIIIPCQVNQSFALTGVYLGSRRPGITFHSIGVNGAAVPDYLKCPYLTRDLKLVRPDMVIFGIGINDAAGPNFDTAVFRRNYLALIDSVRSVNPHCAIVFFTNNDSYRRSGSGRKAHYNVNNNGPLVRETMMRLAAEIDGAVWDQFEIMGGLKSMDKWYKEGLAQQDRVHFTRKGYSLVGDLFYEALAKHLNQSGKYATASTKDRHVSYRHDSLPRGIHYRTSNKHRPSAQKCSNDTSVKRNAQQKNTKTIPQEDADRFPYISY